MVAYELHAADIRGNVIEIPEYITKLTKKFKIIIAFDENDGQAEDEYLLALAEEREKNGSGITYTLAEVMEHHGITQEDLDNAEEDEFE